MGDTGLPFEQKTPLTIFSTLVNKNNNFIIENFDHDYYRVTNPSTAVEFTVTELNPILKTPTRRNPIVNNYYYNVIIHLGIDIEDEQK